jgi:hypothetical protein
MKKSRAVRISLVSSLAGAALSAGCGTAGALRKPPGWQACVDRAQDIVVEARYCVEEMNQSATLDLARPYAWYYYPWTDYWEGPAIGGPVPPGGSYSLRPVASVPTTGSGVVVRGGLGSTAAGHVSTGG